MSIEKFLRDKRELSVDNSHPFSKEELDFINPKDSFTTVAGKLSGILDQKGITVFMGDKKSAAATVGFYLEGYLNNFSALDLLKRNLLQLINKEDGNSIFFYHSAGPEDEEFCTQLRDTIENPHATAEDINKILLLYKERGQKTNFKKHLTDEYSTYYKHYADRMMYSAQEVDYQKMRKKAVNFSKSAKKEYEKRQFVAAFNLFSESLKLCTYCLLKSSEELASIYYSVGRCLFHSEKYQDAMVHLEIALTLHQNYVKSPETKINKVKSALKECINTIKASNRNVETQVPLP